MDVGGGALWSFLALRQIFDATELLLHTLQQHRDRRVSNNAKTLLRNDSTRNRRLLNMCYALNLNCRKSESFIRDNFTKNWQSLNACYALVSTEKSAVFSRQSRLFQLKKTDNSRCFFAVIALVSSRESYERFAAFFGDFYANTTLLLDWKSDFQLKSDFFVWFLHTI